MADVVRTFTSHARTVGVTLAVVALFGGTATTISLADSSSPTPKPAKVNPAKVKPQTSAKPAAAKPKASGRPTDTHGYCVSHAVAAAKAKGATGEAVAAAAHSCPKKAHKAKPAHTPADKPDPKTSEQPETDDD